MELTEFCPKCGKEREKLYGDRGLCGRCYTEDSDLLDLPDTINIVECRYCGKVENKGQWHRIEGRKDRIWLKLEGYGEEGIEIEFELIDGEKNESLKLKIEREDLVQTRKLNLELKKEICRQCGEFEGDYAKTKIQIRGVKTSKIQKKVEIRASKLEKNNHDDFLLNKKHVEGGVDFYLSTEHMSQKIVHAVKREYQVKIERSYQKIGNKNGKEIYQNTVVLRMD